jgi:uncharacterized protein YbjT (DUF2867 family)
MKIIIFGATGLAGGGVLNACLAAPLVDEVRAITRRPLCRQHNKLYEFIHNDFLNYSAVRDSFAGIDACLFCLGVSVMQVPGEGEYRRITHDFTLAAARELKENSPSAVFHYISGQGTSLNSRFMWARVKAQTEQELIKMMKAVGWRPAFIEGAQSAGSPKLFKVLQPVLKLLKPFSSFYVEAQDLGRAMIQATEEKIHGRVIENAEIRKIAGRYGSFTV